MKIDSRGAGLPLIVLGLTAVVLAVLRGAPEQTATAPVGGPVGTTGQTATTTPAPNRDTTTTAAPSFSATPASCVDEHLDGAPAVQKGLRARLPEGQTAQIVGNPAALVLTRDTEITGAVRLQYQPIGRRTLTIIDVVDGSCRPGSSTVREVHNGFVVTLELPDRQYKLDVSYESSPAIPIATLSR